jgi:hypothetical protein
MPVVAMIAVVLVKVCSAVNVDGLVRSILGQAAAPHSWSDAGALDVGEFQYRIVGVLVVCEARAMAIQRA